MKKLLVVLALAGISTMSFAQEDPTLKNSVATNSFWSNWFVQAGAQWSAFYAGHNSEKTVDASRDCVQIRRLQ